MNKRVLIHNGPPNSGKDLAVSFTAGHHKMFKSKLFELVLAIYNIDSETFFGLYNNRKTKEKPSELLYGRSPRDALIHTSETLIKPNFDKEYFGRCAAQNLEFGLNVFSDGGFVEEINPIYELVGPENLLIVRLHRPGCDFSNDSRDYIKSYKDVNIVDVHNDRGIINFRNSYRKKTDDFIQRGTLNYE